METRVNTTGPATATFGLFACGRRLAFVDRGNASSDPMVSRGFSRAAALVVGVVVAVLAVLIDRKVDRWWKRNHPLAGAKARLEQTKTKYRSRRDFAVEATEVAAELFSEISQATAARRRPAPSA
jgi:hypothetical protein